MRILQSLPSAKVPPVPLPPSLCYHLKMQCGPWVLKTAAEVPPFTRWVVLQIQTGFSGSWGCSLDESLSFIVTRFVNEILVGANSISFFMGSTTERSGTVCVGSCLPDTRPVEGSAGGLWLCNFTTICEPHPNTNHAWVHRVWYICIVQFVTVSQGWLQSLDPES